MQQAKKYNILLEERSELIKETFELMDASKATSAAEIENICNRMEAEYELRLETEKYRADDHIRYLETRIACCKCHI